MKKMFLSLLLCMLALTAGAYDFAADYTFEVNLYESDSGEYIPSMSIGGGGGGIGAISYEAIPEVIEVTITLYYNINPDGSSVSVTSGPSPYSDTYISFPATVKHDGKTYAVTAIGQHAFNKSLARYVNIPDNIKELGVGAFSESEYLQQVSLSKNLKSIPNETFIYCKNLRQIDLPKGIEDIGISAFSICESLTSIQLPSTLKTIGDECFLSCGLSSIEIPAGVKVLPYECFAYCSNLKDVRLKDGLENIGRECFRYCTELRQINLSETLETISSEAFSGCSKLMSVELPNSVKSVEYSAFSACDSLQTITFSSSMTSIPVSMCSGCKVLNNVVIPSNITSINDMAFSPCENLSNLKLHDEITHIGFLAFSGTGLTSFTYPSKMEYSGGSMLSDCLNLQEVYMGDNIKGSTNDFSGCISLKRVRLSENLTGIDGSCFSGCVSLDSVTIPRSVTILNDYCFSGCSSLKNITLSENIEVIGGHVFDGTAIENFVYPPSIKSISVFGWSQSIKYVTIPYSIENVEVSLFEGCPNLKEVHLQKTQVPNTTDHSGLWRERMIWDNMATLFVPRGTSELYKNDIYWNAFHEIVEEDVPDVYYQLTYETKSGRGSVLVNEEPIEYDRTMLLLNTGATVKFVPETTGWASSSYLIDHVLLNGNDITSELVDGVYTISTVETNYYFEAYYRSAPLTLHILNGAGGSVDLNVEKGESITFTVVPDDGWTVSSVFFNGTDCTSEILCGNKVTTYAITDEATISVTLEDNNGDAMVNSASWNGIKAFALHNSIHVTGVETVMPITIYSADGKEIRTVSAQSGETIINGLNADNTYIVKVGSKTFKLYL